MIAAGAAPRVQEEQRSNGAENNFRPVDKPGEERPGLSAFALEDGVVYHACSCYARGLDAINGAYQLLDLAPKGRDETCRPVGERAVERLRVVH